MGGMKKLIIIILLFSAPAFASQWCQWDGSAGVECQSDSRGYILINGFPTKTESIANTNGYYKVVVTEPEVGADQVKDAVVWSRYENKIGYTWTVRDKTSEELDTETAEPMPLSEYYLWKVLLLKNVVTAQELVNNLPAELKNAYLARDRLVNP